MFISVIVTAYNRRDYLDSALKSLENQTNKTFETILVTNFDYDINNYKLNIKHIKMEGTIGEFLCAGIQNSNGEIISFMDDDDLFFKEKMYYVNKIFSNRKEIGYLHNRRVTLQNNMKKDTILNRIDWNMSCISIKKTLILNYIGILKKITISPDTFCYLSSLDAKAKIKNLNKPLTYYRIWNKNISTNPRLYPIIEENLQFFENSFKSKKSLKHINKLLLIAKYRVFLNDNSNHKINVYDFINFVFSAIILTDLEVVISSVKNVLSKRFYF